MPKNEILESIKVEKLIFGGKGLGVAPDGRKVIISGGVIPGSTIDVRVLKARKSHYEGQQVRVVKKSPIEVGLQPGHQMYGGAKWLTIGYEDQLRIKEEQVKEAFYPILKWLDFSTGQKVEQDFSSSITDADGLSRNDRVQTSQSTNQQTRKPANTLPTFHPIIPSPEIYGYRNKVEFSWGKYISAREGVHDEFRFGFHAQGQFDRIEDCTYCALADDELNAIFKTIDTLSRASGLPTYDPKTGEGFWRHLVIRQGKLTGETMVVFSVNGEWDNPVMSTIGDVLPGKVEQDFSLHSKGREQEELQELFGTIVKELTEKFPTISSMYFLENTGRADIVTGKPVLIYGKPSIEEELLGMRFEIQPKSFFQVNTPGAERLYSEVIRSIKGKVHKVNEQDASNSTNLQPYEPSILLDLYAGTGTIGILLSKYFDEVYSVELVESASRDGEGNALKNSVKNVRFVCSKVEDFVREFRKIQGEDPHISTDKEESKPANQQTSKNLTIVLDPPRDGMHPSALPHIISFAATEIIYVSCNPSTLARDLEVFVGKTRDEKTEALPRYRITDVTPVDMFPHTHHIETVVRMERV